MFRDIQCDNRVDGEWLSHVDDCVECVFQYIAMLKTGPQRWIYDEVTKVNNQSSETSQSIQLRDRTREISSLLSEFGGTFGGNLLKIRSKTHNGDVESFESKNMYIIFVSKNAINADDLCEASEEEWYGTKYMDYSMKNIQGGITIKREQRSLHAEPNRFVASVCPRDLRSVQAKRENFNDILT